MWKKHDIMIVVCLDNPKENDLKTYLTCGYKLSQVATYPAVTMAAIIKTIPVIIP